MIACLTTEKDDEMYSQLLEKLERAEALHPVFAEGIYQGFGRITEELGECAQAVNHAQPEARVLEEAWDLLVVVWRFVRKDYVPKL